MFDSLKVFSDRFFGRGDAAITVPVMDGALKANRVLDDAEVLAELPGIDDIASDGTRLWVAAGAQLLTWDGGALQSVQWFDAGISALAAQPGWLAVALGGTRIRVMRTGEHGLVDVATLEQCAGTPLVSVNALAFDQDDRLLFTEGSRRHGPDGWCRDLMERGKSGRVGCWAFLGPSAATELRRGMAHAYGVIAVDGQVLASETWRHRVVVARGSVSPWPRELPAYPSRMTPAAAGGFWLACFVSRTQLVEFVLREPAYRERMLAEVKPSHWIAPALASGKSFLEPLQGAGVKTMGVMKPWAPPRSYGLVIRVARDGRVLGSIHSQVDGRHHGITGVAEHGGRLFAASKGSGRLLSVDVQQGFSA